MSEDLRYYFFDNEAETPPPAIPAEEGWKQMKQLLDKEMPRKKRPLTGIILPYAVAASVLIAGIFVTLKLTDGTGSKRATEVSAAGVQNEPPTSNKNNVTPETVAAAPTNKTDRTNNNNNNLLQDNATGNSNALSAQQTTQLQTAQQGGITTVPGSTTPQTGIASSQHSLNPLQQNKTLQNIGSAENNNNSTVTGASQDNKQTPPLTYKDDVAVPSLTKKKNANNKTWNLLAGVGLNMTTTGNPQNVQPYPAVAAKYNVSKRLYASAGLAAFSPSGIQAEGTGPSYYVDDRANNVLKYDEVVSYKNFRYVDVPLMLGVKLTDKLAVEGGVQVSWLMSKTEAISTIPYDYNLNRMAITYNPTEANTMLGPSIATPTGNDAKVNQRDLRYVAGLQYSFNKINVGLQYQQGNRAAVTGTNINSKKTGLVSLRVGFTIK
ncbi:hypothetical protein [Foetidibacter luteolus]|uniref:hypothetical protein n=1 Tax=Foetidibacter luteolus TaxID=2608880 RepID=UPI00129B7BCB|nr:hypothetical protein [Foetidibacter luteolus]